MNDDLYDDLEAMKARLRKVEKALAAIMAERHVEQHLSEQAAERVSLAVGKALEHYGVAAS